MAVYYAHIVLPNVTASDGQQYDKVTFYELTPEQAGAKTELERKITAAQVKVSEQHHAGKPGSSEKRQSARLDTVFPLIERNNAITGPVHDIFLPVGVVMKGDIIEELPTEYSHKA